MKSILLVCALVLTISGCISTTGAKVEPDQLVGFEKGVTTEADIVKKLGRPAVSTASSDGSKVLTYAFSNYKVRGATFIPIVGLFAGGTDMQMRTTTFIMGTDGTMTSHQSSDTNMSTGPGVQADAKEEANAAQ